MTVKNTNTTITLILLDVISVIFSFLLAYYLRNFGFFRLFLNEIQPLETYLKVLPVTVLTMVVVFFSFSLYSRRERSRSINEVYLSMKAMFTWILLLMSFSYLSKYDYSRIIVLLTFLINLFILTLLRLIFKQFEARNFQKGIGLRKILIIGAGRPGRTIARKLMDLKNAGYEIVGFVDDHARSREQFPVIGKLSQLDKLISKHSIDVVYVTDPRMSYEEILTIASGQLGNRVSFKITSDIFGLISRSSNPSQLGNIPSLELWKSDMGYLYQLVKRTMDLILSLCALIATLPLWIIIYIIVIADDGDPVLINLDRVGYKGKKFKMYKFRTMKIGTNRSSNPPRSIKDNRVTRFGRILRATSLDELPQLLNIIKGEMSFVGPRPEMPQIVKSYTKWQKLRLQVKPGLTGLWQVLGRKDLPLHENLEYDFYYINNQSILMDLTIILKTIPIVLIGKGAY